MLNQLNNIRDSGHYDYRITNAGIFLMSNGLIYNISNFYISSDVDYRKNINFHVKVILNALNTRKGSVFSYPLTNYKNIQEILSKNNTDVNIIFIVFKDRVHRLVFVGKELIEEEYYGNVRRIK